MCSCGKVMLQCRGVVLQAPHAAGSLLGLCWSPDATRVAGVGGTGALVIAAVLEVCAVCRSFFIADHGLLGIHGVRSLS